MSLYLLGALPGRMRGQQGKHYGGKNTTTKCVVTLNRDTLIFKFSVHGKLKPMSSQQQQKKPRCCVSLVLIYELMIQVRSLPFLLAWTPQSPLCWHIREPCGTLFTIRVLLEYEKWEMSRSVWEVVEVKSGLRQPDISAPLQTNDPPHRRKKRWLGQFEWITLKGCLEWFFLRYPQPTQTAGCGYLIEGLI